MNVYDFDGTIYRGDSTVDFYCYSLWKKPTLIRFLPKQVWGIFRYLTKQIDKTTWKESFFSFLNGIPDINKYVSEFWNVHSWKIMAWYLQQQEKDDLIISASPEFLLSEICSRLGITNLIASKVDPLTGMFQGKNCRGEEKVRIFRDCFGSAEVERFYSDSQSDMPMALLAKEAFLVNGPLIKEWKVSE